MNIVGANAAGQIQLQGESSGHRLQVEIAVGNVQGDDAARRQLLKVKLDGLFCDQMNRDGVGAKGVDDDDAETAIGLVLQGKAGIT